MSSHGNQNSDTEMDGPPASAGILFAMGGLGFFYGLIAFIDPLL